MAGYTQGAKLWVMDVIQLGGGIGNYKFIKEEGTINRVSERYHFMNNNCVSYLGPL